VIHCYYLFLKENRNINSNTDESDLNERLQAYTQYLILILSLIIHIPQYGLITLSNVLFPIIPTCISESSVENIGLIVVNTN